MFPCKRSEQNNLNLDNLGNFLQSKQDHMFCLFFNFSLKRNQDDSSIQMFYHNNTFYQLR